MHASSVAAAAGINRGKETLARLRSSPRGAEEKPASMRNFSLEKSERNPACKHNSLKGVQKNAISNKPHAAARAGGRVEGDIRVNGFPKEQKTFARVTGYVEQSDIHSPQARLPGPFITS